MNQITEKMGPFGNDLYIVFAPRDDASYSVDFSIKKPGLLPFCASIMKLTAGQTATLVTSQYKVLGKKNKWASTCDLEVFSDEDAAAAGPNGLDPNPPTPPTYCVGAPGSGCGFVSPCPSGTQLVPVDGGCKCVPGN